MAVGFGVTGLEGDASAAKGSAVDDGGLEGGAKADCRVDDGGWGVLDCEVVAGAELKAEKGENPGGGGVDVDRGPLALLLCVIDESNAGPGISRRGGG